MSIRDEAVRRWRTALAWLRVETPNPSRLTAWAWAADIILALLLAVGAVNGAAEPHVDGNADLPVHIEFRDNHAGPPGPIPPEAFGPELPVNHDGPAGGLLVVAALTALPLITRRRYPLGSFLVIAVCAFRIYRHDGDPTWTVIASVIAAYSAAMYSRYRNLALASVVAAAVLAVGFNRDNLPSLPSGVLTFLLLSSVGVAANAIHTWRQRARTLEREHEAATRLAVDRERARLARELHDVVTHNVSVMVVQAGAARKVMDTAPDLAREALLAVEAGGRAAMTELRQAIGLLTVDSDGGDLAPQPGLDRLDELVARVRETGAAVTLAVAAPAGVPAGVGLAAYRVVQEALTNAVKHAAGARVHVEVTVSQGVLRVDVADDGGTPLPARHGSGRGLAGLHERVAVYGGTLTAGPRPTGGFRVVAELPLRQEADGEVA